MGSRLQLHNKLLTFTSNVYFQPPSNVQIKYPCIVYNKTDKDRLFGNDGVYLSKQGYQITLIERDPDSTMADDIELQLQHCTINQYYTVDNLNHTILSLYF